MSIEQPSPKPVFYAHSQNQHDKWHALKNHLTDVAKLAGENTADWQGQEEAKLAGLLHDLGKYGDKFQDRLNGKGSGLDHWSQGAFLAIKKAGACTAAIAIQGHHIGLQRLQKEDLQRLKSESLQNNHPQNLVLSEADFELLEQRFNDDDLEIKKPQTRLFNSIPQGQVDNMLDVRRLFSALVDADFIDTEAHFNGNGQGKVYRQSGLKLNEYELAEKALATLSAHIKEKSQETNSATTLHDVRQQLLQACLKKAEQKTGTFTLTAPTGSGKTLSMLSFALKHALENKLQRVIMVVPYLSIIEQTAAVYREVFKDFPEDFILEHHSMAGLGKENIQTDAEGNDEAQQQIKRQRLLSENWDAPIVITTSVQFLESLFSNRSSSCRKIHRIANAVILFDEVQTLPTALAIPSLAAVSHIAHHWNSSVVFSTATQPAFEHLDTQVKAHCSAGWQPQPIVENHAAMMKITRRVEFEFLAEKLDWQTLATKLSEHTQVLCIVNLKRHALELLKQLEDTDDLFHLSTNLCPLHRQQVLAEVRGRLKQGLPCRLIATQCIEAGVDVDFPVVYRSFAPLDALIQAAGRCNREGKQTELGKTFVFEPDSKGFPDDIYEQATDATKSLKNELGDKFDLYDPDVINRYYRILYSIAKIEHKQLHTAIAELDFPEVANEYRLIKNDMINIVVPFDKVLLDELEATGRNKGLCADWIKQARKFIIVKRQLNILRTQPLSTDWLKQVRGLSISLYRPKNDDVIWDSLIPVQPLRQARNKVREDWFIVNDDYDAILGYQRPDSFKCQNY